MLLNSRDPETGAGMADRQLRDEMITLLIAGHETVASALTWTCYLLSQHPACADSLYAEVSRALAGRPPGASDLANLAFTRQVFDEALRLYPPAWIITRKALQEDRIAGFQVKANSLLILSPYTIHRHPAFWENPEAFDPGHFPFAGPRFAYIPFGGGPRLCIGEGFARVEGQLILACLAQRCRLEPAPGQQAQVEALVTLRPRNGLKMTVHKIKNAR
jgi:cytochrome P450